MLNKNLPTEVTCDVCRGPGEPRPVRAATASCLRVLLPPNEV